MTHIFHAVDWQILTAGTVTDIATRDLFIASVKKYAAAGLSDQPFCDLYDASNGAAGNFCARPAVGGHLGRRHKPFESSNLMLILLVHVSDTALVSYKSIFHDASDTDYVTAGFVNGAIFVIFLLKASIFRIVYGT